MASILAGSVWLSLHPLLRTAYLTGTANSGVGGGRGYTGTGGLNAFWFLVFVVQRLISRLQKVISAVFVRYVAKFEYAVFHLIVFGHVLVASETVFR